MFVEGKPRTVFFPPDTLFTAFVATRQKIMTYALGAHDLLGQLRIGERQVTSAPLPPYNMSKRANEIKKKIAIPSLQEFHRANGSVRPKLDQKIKTCHSWAEKVGTLRKVLWTFPPETILSSH